MTPGTDERQSAVALSYLDETRAPVVVAKGYGVTAESIMREARVNGLYVHASPALNKLLMQVDLDQRIRRSCTWRWPKSWPGSTGWRRPSPEVQGMEINTFYYSYSLTYFCLGELELFSSELSEVDRY